MGTFKQNLTRIENLNLFYCGFFWGGGRRELLLDFETSQKINMKEKKCVASLGINCAA